MKYRFLILTFFAALLVGCKENQWLDWKAQNDLWLEQNIAVHQGDPNFHVLSDGLQYRIIADPTPDDTQAKQAVPLGVTIQEHSLTDTNLTAAMEPHSVCRTS